MKRARTHMTTIAAFALAVVLATTAGDAQTQVSINLAEYGSGIGPWCVYAAQDENIFAKAGVRFGNVIQIIGDPNIVSALISGQSDIAIGSAGSIVPVANGQTDQLLVIAASEDSPVALVTPDEVTSVGQLAGKTIALPQHNSSNSAIGEALLDEIVGKGKWTPLYIGGATAPRLAAVQTGKAAGAYINEPADLDGLGPYHILTRFGSRLRYFNGPVLSTRAWLRNNPDAAIRFLWAFAKGCDYILDRKNRQSAIDLLAKHTPIREQVAAEIYDYYVAGPARGRNPPQDGRIDLQGFANTIGVLKNAGIITNKDFDFRSAVDSSYLDRALKISGTP